MITMYRNRIIWISVQSTQEWTKYEVYWMHADLLDINCVSRGLFFLLHLQKRKVSLIFIHFYLSFMNACSKEHSRCRCGNTFHRKKNAWKVVITKSLRNHSENIRCFLHWTQERELDLFFTRATTIGVMLCKKNSQILAEPTLLTLRYERSAERSMVQLRLHLINEWMKDVFLFLFIASITSTGRFRSQL